MVSRIEAMRRFHSTVGLGGARAARIQPNYPTNPSVDIRVFGAAWHWIGHAQLKANMQAAPLIAGES